MVVAVQSSYNGQDMKPIKDIDLAQLFIETRDHLGYNQKQMANLLEVEPSALNQWEHNKRQPNGQVTAKVLLLRELLGLPLRPRTPKKKS